MNTTETPVENQRNTAWKQLASLFGPAVDLTPYQLGEPQQAGALTVVPVFGPEHKGFAAPGEGATLARVYTYGDVELRNKSTDKIAIVPLHMGYIQQGAQNHALCGSALLLPGKVQRFKDACCVQAAQGGLLTGAEQWFFVLPVELRSTALKLQGQSNYAKLWGAISKLNQRYDLPARGHLEQILTRQRAYLTQFRSRFELLEGQIGALFFFNTRLMGIEIAPNAAYFADVWMPLVCFAYGVGAYAAEKRQKTEPVAQPFPAETLSELRHLLNESRAERDATVDCWLAKAVPTGKTIYKSEAHLKDLTLHTVTGSQFAGQTVHNGNSLVYASLFAIDRAIK